MSNMDTASIKQEKERNIYLRQEVLDVRGELKFKFGTLSLNQTLRFVLALLMHIRHFLPFSLSNEKPQL